MRIYFSVENYIDVSVDDSSQRYRSIMGKNEVELNFVLGEYVDFAAGCYIEYQGQNYFCLSEGRVTKRSEYEFEYNIIFKPHAGKLALWTFRNTAIDEFKFSATLTPRELLEMIVENLNLQDGGWQVGECIVSDRKTFDFENTKLDAAFLMGANMFCTECEIIEKKLHYRKVEYGKQSPMVLSYGMGNGFLPGVGMLSSGGQSQFEVLLIQGGDKNLDRQKYDAPKWHLPKSAELEYDGVTYQTDAKGREITIKGKPLTTGADLTLPLTEMYPKRQGLVSEVIVVSAENRFVDFRDTSIPEALDYSLCRIGGETASIEFQSGMLAGRTFDIDQTADELTGYIHAERRFRLVPKTEDGVEMPAGVYMPAVGDKYAVYGIMLPDAYVADNVTKTGVEWDMFREACRYFSEKNVIPFSFSGELDGKWAKQDWINRGGMLEPGWYIRFTDPDFKPDGYDVRIVGMRDYINNPYCPQIELCNDVVSTGISTEFAKLDALPQKIEREISKNYDYTNRGFADAQRTTEMLVDAKLAGFSDSISPLTINTMQLLVGAKEVQFSFVSSKLDNQVVVKKTQIYNKSTKKLTVEGGILKHHTIGIDYIGASHKANEYKYWDMPIYVSAALTDMRGMYLYARCNRSNGIGAFKLSFSAIAIEEEVGWYHFLVGILNPEIDGTRSYAPMYGFSLVEPGRIVADRFQSSDFNWEAFTGACIDFSANPKRIILGGNAEIITNSLTIKKPGENPYKIEDKIEDNYEYLNGRIDGITESFYDNYDPDLTNEPAKTWVDKSEEESHLKASFTNFITGQSWIWLKNNNNIYGWGNITNTEVLNALATAGEALAAAKNAQEAAANANTGISDLGDYIDGAFRDGVIDTSEAKAIKEQLKSINETKISSDNSYNAIYSNKYLTGNAKTNLATAKVDLDAKRNALISCINNIVVNVAVTDVLRAAYDNAYIAYNASFGAFSTRIEQATRNIEDNLSQGKVDNLQIGAVNLINPVNGAWKTSDVFDVPVVPDPHNEYAYWKILPLGEIPKDQLRKIQESGALTIAWDYEMDKAELHPVSGEYSTADFIFISILIKYVGGGNVNPSGNPDGGSKIKYKGTPLTKKGTLVTVTPLDKTKEIESVATWQPNIYIKGLKSGTAKFSNFRWYSGSRDIGYTPTAYEQEEAIRRQQAMASDGIISQEEKATLRNENEQIKTQYNTLKSLSSSYQISTAALDTAYNDVQTLFGSGFVNIAENTDFAFDGSGIKTRTEYNKRLSNWKNQTERISDAIAKKEIDNIKVGGVNLLDCTDFKVFQAWNGATSANTTIIDDKLVGVVGYNHLFDQYIPIERLKSNTEYVISLYAKKQTVTPDYFIVNHINFSDKDKNHISAITTFFAARNATEFVQAVQKFKIDSIPANAKFIHWCNYSRDSGTTCYFHSAKLEEGNKPTGWSPSYYDQAKGVNLLDGTDFRNNISGWRFPTTYSNPITEGDITFVRVGYEFTFHMRNKDKMRTLKKGEAYTISALVRNNIAKNRTRIIMLTASGADVEFYPMFQAPQVLNRWELVSRTFIPSEDYVAIKDILSMKDNLNGTVDIACIKIEKGILNTAWSLSDGDTSASYLKNTFEAAKATDTVVSGGLIQSSVIGLKNLAGKVKTIISGLTTGNTAEIALAAGIPDNGDVAQAKTRIMMNGDIHAENAYLRGIVDAIGGNIGGFSIGNTELSNAKENGGIVLSSKNISSLSNLLQTHTSTGRPDKIDYVYDPYLSPPGLQEKSVINVSGLNSDCHLKFNMLYRNYINNSYGSIADVNFRLEIWGHEFSPDLNVGKKIKLHEILLTDPARNDTETGGVDESIPINTVGYFYIEMRLYNSIDDIPTGLHIRCVIKDINISKVITTTTYANDGFGIIYDINNYMYYKKQYGLAMKINGKGGRAIIDTSGNIKFNQSI